MAYTNHRDPIPVAAEPRWPSMIRIESHTLAMALVAFLAAVVYLNTLSHGFVWDDQMYVLDNPQFKKGEDLLHYFVSDFCEGVNENCYFYRPVVALTYLLDNIVWGAKPFGFHFTNIMWHILDSLLVYWAGWYLFQNKVPALFGGALFAVHPVHTESIAFVAARTDPLATFFYLLAFIMFVKSLRVEGYKWTIYRLSSLLSFAVALMAKEVAVTLPLVLSVYCLLYYHLLREREELWPRLRPSIPYWILVVGYLLMRKLILGHPFSSESTLMGFTKRLLTMPLLLLDNIRVLSFPWPLIALRDGHEYKEMADPFMIAAILLLMIILWTMFRVCRSPRETLFGLTWVLITLSPFLNLIPIPWPRVTDRFLYLPSVGLCLTMGWWEYRALTSQLVNKSFNIRLMFGTATIGVFLLFMGMTIHRNRDWKDNVTFWEKTVQQIPSRGSLKALAYNNLAYAYQEKGEMSKAEVLLEEVLRSYPKFSPASINLVGVYGALGKYQESLRVYQTLLDSTGKLSFEDDGEGGAGNAKGLGSAKLYYNIGVTYSRLGDLDRAMDAFERSRSLNPRNHLVYNALGNLYSKSGRLADAESAFLEAVRLRPDSGVEYKNLGSFYIRHGNYQEAAKVLEEVVLFESGDVNSYLNLGSVYLQLAKLDLAAGNFEKGLRLSPSNASLHYNLGLTYQKLGYLEQALVEYKRALTLEPTNPEAHNNLGGLLEAMRDLTGAMDEYERAVSLQPDYITAQINLGRMKAETGNREEALQQYKLVLKQIPPPFEESPHGRYVLEQIRLLNNEGH